ncbi:MAG: DarT ssDNA thymidine ADP-ribosyltransferase family protein [Chloroflexota bacterium]|nr:DarT ssDNA thymidine ADP-ribosyltransferase family protein [Chloroflexota bacterium]
MLEHGILSHSKIVSTGLPFKRIYSQSIVEGRQHRTTPEGRTLWDYANLYFQPRNAMLYQVSRQTSLDDICVVGVRQSVLNRPDVFITTGNAASYQSEILPKAAGNRRVREIIRNTDKEWWSDLDGSKRQMMAECLVPDAIAAEDLAAIYVGTTTALAKVQADLRGTSTQATREPSMFFLPQRLVRVSDHLTLSDGDLFFSGMQTLTISVNTAGVMGKGLASTAKWRFPDVYVKYQDLCRRKILKMGKPVVVKRERSVEEDLAEDPASVNGNGAHETWFLLFATKDHWRNNADPVGIEQGLIWLRDHYRDEGISSLALPALGCGLGNLTWHQVGPMMCRYLEGMSIPSSIYLPTPEPPLEQLTREFLLTADNSSAASQGSFGL